MTDNSPLNEALAMLREPESPSTESKSETPHLPPNIAFGTCRFYKNLKQHEHPAVKIRIAKNEKDLLKKMCADMGLEYHYGNTPTYEWNVYPLVSLRHAVRVVDIFKAELSFPPSFPAEAKMLVERLLDRDPSVRLGAGPGDVKELEAHTLFADLDFAKVERKEYTPVYAPKIDETFW